VAFVANSLSSNARLEITDPEISMSHPVTANLDAPESPGTATFAAGTLSHPEIDGIGSVAIGFLLAGTSAFLARESKSLLLGERAYPSVRKSILAIANKHPGCLKANGLITVQLGPEQVVGHRQVND
jgi:hypothetical protein